jgi:hypothetical protein
MRTLIVLLMTCGYANLIRYAKAAALIAKHPETTVIINHLGSPTLEDLEKRYDIFVYIYIYDISDISCQLRLNLATLGLSKTVATHSLRMHM